MTLYSKYLALRNEIMKHKWIESEKNQRDIGFEAALTDWVTKHRRGWIGVYKQVDKGN